MVEPEYARLVNRALAAYWGMAVGDALGATVEFMTPQEIRHQYGEHNRIRGGGWLKLKTGQVTDDTDMALALGDAIVEQGAVKPESIARHFDLWMKKKPVDIGNTVRRGIVNYRKTGNVEVAESNDAGNGACMRLLPVALFTLGRTRDEIVRVSRAQAHITHNNRLSDAACEAVIEIIQGAIYGADKNTLLHGPIKALKADFPEFEYRARRMENPGGYIVDTIIAVLQAFIDTDTYRDCIVDVVNRGGDADTTGAIAGMIAGAYYGLEGIPVEWLTALDSQTRVRCRQQTKHLLNAAARSLDTDDESAMRVAV